MTTSTVARPSSRRSDRVDTIHQMLVNWDAARSEGSSVGGGGSHLEARINTWDATTWTREYQELDRCLVRLRYLAGHGRPMISHGVSSSAAWWTIQQRYLEAVVVRREVFLRRTHSGERVPVSLPRNCEVVSRATIMQGKSSFCMVRTWDTRVDPADVDAALRWIAKEYRGVPACYKEVAA